MRLVKSSETKPELQLRKLLFSLGYRYRIHFKALPGKPDIVFTKKKKVIFVHGCFWHQHESDVCRRAKIPKTKVEYWGPKLNRNRERDKENIKKLESMGWSVEVVWECELKDVRSLTIRLKAYLE